VKATYEWVLEKKNLSPHRISIMNIDRIVLLDNDRFDIFLKKPDPSFVGYLVIGIVPKALLDAGNDFTRNPVGSGPFQFARWPIKDILVLRRLRDNKLFEFIHINNSTTRVLKLLNREIDILQNNLPIELVNHLQANEHIKIVRRQGINFSYIGFNLQDKDLKKLAVRQAIAHAINRKRIVEKMFGPKTRLASAIFIPEHWAGHPNLTSYEYNPDKARGLLKQAGYTKENPLEIVYNSSNDPFRVTLATILQYQLKQVGIKLTLRTYDFSTVYRDIKKGNFQLFSLTWVAVKSPDLFRFVYHSKSIPNAANGERGANRFRLIDEKVDHYIEAAENTTDQAKRVQYYRKIHERLIELVPVVPLWYEEQMAAMQKTVRGYRLSNDGAFDSLVHVEKEVKTR
jgi:peptide/nickel transport system substrate-binding protein